jgi:hypothetical protein
MAPHSFVYIRRPRILWRSHKSHEIHGFHFLRGQEKMRHMKSGWMVLLALAGVGAFAACGAADEATSSQEPVSSGQVRQESHVDIGSALGPAAASGNLFGGTNSLNPPASCSTSPGGADISFKWKAPYSDTFTFTTAGSVFDTVLHIYTFNPDTATNLLGCNEDASETVVTSSVSLSLTQDTVVRIVVDSYTSPLRAAAGSYTLNISSQSPPCMTTTDPCRTAPGTWNGTSCAFPAAPFGTSCSDDDACTTGEVCNGSGTCTGGQAVTCNLSNASSSCTQNGCAINTCNSGYGNCDGNNSNGCETNTDSNTSHCGACNNVCGSGMICRFGGCEPQCEPCGGSLCCAPKACRPKPNFPEIELCM